MEHIEKKYSDIVSVDNTSIVFNDGSTLYFSNYKNIERDITANPPYFVFKTENEELYILFDETGLLSKRKNIQRFHVFYHKLGALGLRSLDLS